MVALQAPAGSPGRLETWTLHDLRRSWATHVAKLTGRVDVVEMALNHRSGMLGGVAGTYMRETFLDERRRAMRLWAVCLLRPMRRRYAARRSL